MLSVCMCLTCLPMFIVVLARKGDDPILTCNASAGKAVTWKFDGNDLENTIIETSLTDDGLRLTVLETNVPVGEYSCWSEGQMLSSHSLYLLLEDKDLGETLFSISHVALSLFQIFKLVHL